MYTGELSESSAVLVKSTTIFLVLFQHFLFYIITQIAPKIGQNVGIIHR